MAVNIITAADVDLVLDDMLKKHDAPADVQEAVQNDRQFRQSVIHSVMLSANMLLNHPEGVKWIMQQLSSEDVQKIVTAAELLGHKEAAEKFAEFAGIKEAAERGNSND